MDIDRTNNELAAMQAIATALSALSDGSSRNRVLRWASEHFNTELVPTVITSTLMVAAPTVVENDDIAELPQAECELRRPCDVENLEELFEERREAVDPVATRARQPQSVVSSLESFVTDFKKLAHDWRNV